MLSQRKIMVTGGAGYVGAVLVPKLLAEGYAVKVVDLYLYGNDVLGAVADNPGLVQVKADIRDTARMQREIPGYDTVIHLACISNDPSYELDPQLGKAINYDAFLGLVDAAKAAGTRNFIYASSSSVYGVKDELEVTEDLPLEPLTDYSKYKALCEAYLQAAAGDDFVVTTLRPSTVCGYSPRQRLDLSVNILTNHALNKGRITVFGGEQKRPNLHIEDMAGVYLHLLRQPDHKIQKKIWNVGYENLKIREIADKVRSVLGGDIPVVVEPTNDIRSYHVCSRKIAEDIGFAASHTVEEAIEDLRRAFNAGKIPNPFEDIRYYNIKTMQSLKLG